MSDIEVPKGHGKWHGGKGSAPKQSDQDKYADNWDKIFKKDNDEFPDRARPDGLAWEKDRREKNDAQLKHEDKVFSKQFSIDNNITMGIEDRLKKQSEIDEIQEAVDAKETEIKKFRSKQLEKISKEEEQAKVNLKP